MLKAPDPKTLKRRVDDYLWRDRSKTVGDLRSILQENFGDFENVAIIGGMIRDLGRCGVAGFKSDVDLVIEAPAHEVAELADRLGARSNSFGGFAYNGPRWKVDFWSLETTWALRKGHISANSLEDLTQGTFFDWDAVLYEVKTRRVVFSEDYFERLNSGRLGLNLRATPSAVGNTIRAVRRLLLWDVAASSELLDFVAETVESKGLLVLQESEHDRYRNSYLACFGTPSELMMALRDFDQRRHLGTRFARQLPLPGISN